MVVSWQDAHNAEILSLTFSSPTKDDSSERYIKGCYFLASGGRDHIIHLYDVDRFLLIITFGSTNLFGVYHVSFTFFYVLLCQKF